jgi:hypothetical protein
MWTMTGLRRPWRSGGARLESRGQQTIEGCGRKTKVDLRRRFATQTGVLKVQIANLLPKAVNFTIEQDDDAPQPLCVVELIDLDHAA